jgi:ribosomal protein S28E/S33
MRAHKVVRNPDLIEILEADKEARELVERLIG